MIPEHGGEIARVTSLILGAAQEQLPVEHPDYPGIPITNVILSGPTNNPNADMKNAVRVGSGLVDLTNPSTFKAALDRCPCGTGTCAKMAVLHAKGQLPLNQEFRHEGLLGTVYTGKLIEETKIGEWNAVVPTIGGQSWIYGFSTYVLDPTDPFENGFVMGDIWA